MKRFSHVLLALILIFAIAGVANAEKVYRLGIGDDPTTINRWAGLGPNESSVYNSYVTAGWYAGLYTYADYTFAFSPNLAADWPGEWVKEGEYYTSIIPLKKGVMWSNGTEFTADDVVFTYSTMIEFDLQGNWYTYHPESLVKVEKVDKYHVKFFWTEEPGLANWNYGTLMSTLMPLSQWGSVVEKARKQPDPAQYLYAAEVTDPVTINGMDFQNWEKGAFFVNTKAEHFESSTTKIYENNRVEYYEPNWKFAFGGEPGTALKYDYVTGPDVDKVLYRLYKNQDAMLMALKKGDIDFWMNSQGLTKGFRQELAKESNVEIVVNPSNGYRYMVFNRNKYPFDILEFNQAVATLIDREMVCNDVLQGAAMPMKTVVSPGNKEWYNADVKAFGDGMDRAQRIAAAVALLEQAGFTWQEKPTVDLENGTYTEGYGIISPNGEPMKPFVILTPPAGYDPLRATFGLYIQVWLQEIGVPAISKPTQFNVIVEKRNSRNYDAYILGWALGGTYPTSLDSFFKTGSGFNHSDFSDPELDAILEVFMKEKEINKAKEYAFQAQERIAETLPYIVLFTTPTYDAYRKDRIQFPFTESLDGIQGSYYGMPTTVILSE